MTQGWDPGELAEGCRSAATRRGYAANWRDFDSWCRARGWASMPATPETVGAYIADRGRALKPATIDRHLAAILVHHARAGAPLARSHPAIRDVLAGLRRRLGVRPQGKTPLCTEEIRAVVAALPRSRAGLRDRAIILLGFAGAFRRSELASLTVADLAFTSEGIAVIVRRGKEDQEGRGMLKGIPFGADEATCPVRNLRRWMIAARLGEGRLFRRIDRHDRVGEEGLAGEAVAAIVKRAVRRWGEREGWGQANVVAMVAAVGGHSLRSGFCTAAARAGAGEAEIMRQTGHRRAETVRRYIREGDPFSHNVAAKLGL